MFHSLDWDGNGWVVLGDGTFHVRRLVAGHESACQGSMSRGRFHVKGTFSHVKGTFHMSKGRFVCHTHVKGTFCPCQRDVLSAM